MTDEVIPDDKYLPQKSLFHIDEVAKFFDVTTRCIHIWVDKDQITKKGNRITREAILRCKYRKFIVGPEL